MYDILIIGGGPAGLSFAKALSDTSLKIGLIEKSPKSLLKAPPYDGREIALTHTSQKIMQDLSIWDSIPAKKISRIQHAKVLNGKSKYALHFDYNETERDTLGYMVSNQHIRKASYTVLMQNKNIDILDETEVKNISTNKKTATITLNDDTEKTASLIIAADSRFSILRRMAGIPTQMTDFGRTCIVCKMTIEKDHLNTALECFFYDHTLAVLPLTDKTVSIVITIDSNRYQDILNMPKKEFEKDIQERVNHQFGKMTLSTPFHSYPLVATYARKFYTNRFALIGDAAVGMHPVTAHGYNLGLQGAYSLANEIKKALKENKDFASNDVLGQYHQKHNRLSKPIYLGTNMLVKIYTKNSLPAKILRRSLLRLGTHIKPAKKMIMDQLTKVSAEKI